MKSPLHGRPFYCREWLFAKLLRYIHARQAGQLECGGVLLYGIDGSGKSALISTLSTPSSSSSTDCETLQTNHIAAYHFCQRFDATSIEVATFIRSLVKQLAECEHVPEEYKREYARADSNIHQWLDTRKCLQSPLDACINAVVKPLCACAPVKDQGTLMILVDALHECVLSTGQAPIGQLLAQIAPLLPKWLFIVATVRRDCVPIFHYLDVFRKVPLDDLRRPHIVADVQQYILTRLDADDTMRSQLDAETADMLNQLHVKSAGCILYLELILDGVRDGFIRMREVQHIPGTLNGLYLWLAQRLFASRSKLFAHVRPILQILLACRRPITVKELFEVARVRNTKLTKVMYAEILRSMGPLLIEYETGDSSQNMDTSLEQLRVLSSTSTLLIFHPSFEQWLTDVKYCTRTYICDAKDGHAALGIYLASKGRELTPEQCVHFAYHLTQMMSDELTTQHLCAFMLQCGAPVNDLILDCPVVDEATTRLLLNAGADFVCVTLTTDGDCMHDEAEMCKSQLSDKSANVGDKDKMRNSDEGIGDTLRSVASDIITAGALHAACSAGDVTLVSELIARHQLLDIDSLDSDGNTALCIAAKHGHANVVTLLSKAGANMNHIGHDQWTPLRSAAFAAHLSTVSALLQCGAEVDHAGTDGRRALRAAAWAGHEDVVNLLISNKANVNAIDDYGRTPLLTAAYMGHVNVVKLLIAAGSRVNHTDADGRTALALCTVAGASEYNNDAPHITIIRALITAGADVNKSDKHGRTPLMSAAIEGSLSMCAVLVNEGEADVDAVDESQCTALSAAAACGHCDIVRQLIEHWHADLNTIDMEGRTVLSIAAGNGHTNVVQLLLDNGLDEMHADNNGWLPIHHASGAPNAAHVIAILSKQNPSTLRCSDRTGRQPLYIAASEGHVHNVAALLDAGCDIHATTHEGLTALWAACMCEHITLCDMLIDAGCEVDVRDIDGQTLVMAMIVAGKTKYLTKLLDRGGESILCSNDIVGRTPLHAAATIGNVHAVNDLLTHGANIDVQDNDGRTALMSSIWAGHTSCTRALLSRGANVGIVCRQQKATALHVASMIGRSQDVTLLLQYGSDRHVMDASGRTAEKVAAACHHDNIVTILRTAGTISSPSRQQQNTTMSSSSGVSSESPPHTFCNTHTNGSNNSHRNYDTLDSSNCTSPDNNFQQQLATRSHRRPFSGVFNDILNDIQLAPLPADDTISSSSMSRRPRIVTNPKFRQNSTARVASQSYCAPTSATNILTTTRSPLNDTLDLATAELERFLTSTEAATSVV